MCIGFLGHFNETHTFEIFFFSNNLVLIRNNGTEEVLLLDCNTVGHRQKS